MAMAERIMHEIYDWIRPEISVNHNGELLQKEIVFCKGKIKTIHDENGDVLKIFPKKAR